MSKDIHFLRLFVHIPARSAVRVTPTHTYSKNLKCLQPPPSPSQSLNFHFFRHERQMKTIHFQRFKGHLNIFLVNCAFLAFAKFSWTCSLFLYWFVSALPPKCTSIHTSNSSVAMPYQQNINKDSQSQYMVEPRSNFPDSQVQALPIVMHRMLTCLRDWKQALQNCCSFNYQGRLLKLLKPTSQPHVSSTRYSFSEDAWVIPEVSHLWEQLTEDFIPQQRGLLLAPCPERSAPSPTAFARGSSWARCILSLEHSHWVGWGLKTTRQPIFSCPVLPPSPSHKRWPWEIPWACPAYWPQGLPPEGTQPVSHPTGTSPERMNFP